MKQGGEEYSRQRTDGRSEGLVTGQTAGNTRCSIFRQLERDGKKLPPRLRSQARCTSHVTELRASAGGAEAFAS